MSYFPSPENYKRNVTDAAAWADAHQATLDAIFDAFMSGGDWPDIDELQRDLDRQRASIDLYGELREMPPSLGGGRSPSPAHLTVRGLHQVPRALPLLLNYMRVIRVAVDRYHSEESNPAVTDKDLTALGITGHDAVLVSQVVIGEGWPFGGGHGDGDGSWSRDVGRDLRYVAGAETVEAFLEVQATLRYGPPPPSEPVSAENDGTAVDARAQQAPETGGKRRAPAAPPPTHKRRAPASKPSPPKRRAAAQTPPKRRRVREPSELANQRGAAKPLSETAFALLTFKTLARSKDEDLFVEAFNQGENIGWNGREEVFEEPRIGDPEYWLTLSLGEAGLWQDLNDPGAVAESDRLRRWATDRELLLQLLELWHREVVSQPDFNDGGWEGSFDRARGQARFREMIGPVLARLDPPLTMHPSGQILAREDPALAPLTDRPLPDGPVADDARDRVTDAVRRFRERNANAEEQRLALEQLAGVFETLKSDGRMKGKMPSKDESKLFYLANEFGIRHLNTRQQDDYGPAFREWIFYALLGSIRLVYRALEEGVSYDDETGPKSGGK